MESKLLEYYNRELAYLREMGAEFAERYPKVAGRLGMRGIGTRRLSTKLPFTYW